MVLTGIGITKKERKEQKKLFKEKIFLDKMMRAVEISKLTGMKINEDKMIKDFKKFY